NFGEIKSFPRSCCKAYTCMACRIDFISPKFEQVFDHKTVWKYRGQILLDVKEMSLEVHIKSVEQRSNQLVIIGDAYLWNGEMRIYQVTDLALGIEEA
ncbi:MAG: hypothetical protein AAFR97_07755, partial [Bacteroidota bacterium]